MLGKNELVMAIKISQRVDKVFQVPIDCNELSLMSQEKVTLMGLLAPRQVKF